ncbi:MAG: hypothetical protein SGJ02_00365 [bacterium]|nr:hypothetical protein [bacterium]
MSRNYILAALVVLFAFEVSAQVRNDFDQDGKSDIVFTSTILTEIAWKSVPTMDGATAITENFGLVKDLTIPGYWKESASPSLAIVRLSGESLVWRLFDGSGEVKLVTFGKKGDLVIAGADFDGDMIADAATVREKNGKLIWKIRLNIFTDNFSDRSVSFGKSGDRVSYINYEGDKDWLVVFGKGPKPKKWAQLKLKNLLTGVIRTVKGFPKELAAKSRPRPLPISAADGEDIFLFVTQDESDTTFLTYSPDGVKLSSKSLVGLGFSVIGNYNTDALGEEILFQNNAKIRIYNPISNTVTEKDKVLGTPVGEIVFASPN